MHEHSDAPTAEPVAAPTAEPVLLRAPNPSMMTLDGTNTWVIAGDGGNLVIDPGPAIASHLDAIAAHGPVAALLLTHQHPDHSEAVPLFDDSVPVYAALPELARGTAALSHGDVIDLAGVRLRVLAVPGHTSDSVCFEYLGGGASAGAGAGAGGGSVSGGPFAGGAGSPMLFTGDTLLGGMHSTLLVERHGGNLADYVDTLRTLETYAGWRGMPGHGPAFDDVAEHASAALAHRLARVEQLRAALAANPGAQLSDIAAQRYPDEPQRQIAALRMIEVEAAYLRGE